MIKTQRHKDPVQRIINYTVNTDKYSVENINRMQQFIKINDKYRKHKFGDIFPFLDYVLETSCKI
jgi:hypothetical protein